MHTCVSISVSISVSNVPQVHVDSDRDGGKIIAFLIRRDHLRCSRSSFHHWMNLVMSDSNKSTFANHLFDRCGMLKKRLYGTFGSETDQGDILYIRNVTMKKEYRRQNLGCKALRQFLQMVCTDPEKPHLDVWWLAGTCERACQPDLADVCSLCTLVAVPDMT